MTRKHAQTHQHHCHFQIHNTQFILNSKSSDPRAVPMEKLFRRIKVPLTF